VVEKVKLSGRGVRWSRAGGRCPTGVLSSGPLPESVKAKQSPASMARHAQQKPPVQTAEACGRAGQLTRESCVDRILELQQLVLQVGNSRQAFTTPTGYGGHGCSSLAGVAGGRR
jgi:hypothetical protein